MAEVLNLTTCTVLSQVTPGDRWFSLSSCGKQKCLSQFPCLQVETAWRALSPTGVPAWKSPRWWHLLPLPSGVPSSKPFTASLRLSRVILKEPNEVTWNYACCVESVMGIYVSYPVGRHITECDANQCCHDVCVFNGMLGWLFRNWSFSSGILVIKK